MRRAHRLDDNQDQVVNALRKLGATVVSLAGVGNGCPDLLVGYRGNTALLELKDGEKPPSARQLTDLEKRFFAAWRGGDLLLVTSVDEAVSRISQVYQPQGESCP